MKQQCTNYTPLKNLHKESIPCIFPQNITYLCEKISIMKIDNNKYFPYFALIFALLPIILWRDFTPSNELRYLSIADEALQNHTFFSFTNHGIPYADKPPLYFWIIMFGKWLFGAHKMWFLSLFSLIPACAITYIIGEWAKKELNEEAQKFARFMLLTCGFFLGLAITLRMDMLMSLFIVLALHSFWKVYQGEDNRKLTLNLFAIYIFLALFTKGPLGILIPLFSTLAFLWQKKQIKQATFFWGLRTWSILITGCLLWFTAVFIEGSSSYLHNLLFHQTIDRAVNAFHHDRPFYYYCYSIWYSIAPWSLLIIGSLFAASRSFFKKNDLLRFFLTTIGCTFLFLSCLSGKLEVYLLPTFPFMVYAAAIYLSKSSIGQWIRYISAFPAFIFILTLPLWIFIRTKGWLPEFNEWLFYPATAILSTSGIYALFILYKHKDNNSIFVATRSMAMGLLLAIFVGGWSISRLNSYIGYREICTKALELATKQKIEDIRTWHIPRAENIDVYLNRPIQIISEENFSTKDLSKPILLIIQKEDIERFSVQKSIVVGPYAAIVCAPSANTYSKLIINHE